MLRTNRQTDKQTDSNILPMPTNIVGATNIVGVGNIVDCTDDVGVSCLC